MDENAAECRAILARGSKSFHAASLLLPPRLRDPVAAVYAFCRVSDDAVDESPDPQAALARLEARLDAIYAFAPEADPVDRALSRVVRAYDLPREPFDGLLEGYAWDVEGRTYETLADLRAYCVRVAGTVGLLMTVLMGERRAHVLERASDLGIAMQLTNIARDVGEDARRGRVYLPLAWLSEVGIDPAALVEAPRMSPQLGFVIRRLLAEADKHYLLARPGMRQLPRDCRLAIAAAGNIYRDIGRVILDNGYDSVNRRAYTSKPRKAWLLVTSLSPVLGSELPPSGLAAAPEARALVAATAGARR